MALSLKLDPCYSVEEAESRAALVALQELAGIYRGKVILEMDCQSIAKELVEQNPTKSPYYGIIMDIKRAMSAFAGCRINCVRRNKNALAHELAALIRITRDQRMLNDIP